MSGLADLSLAEAAEAVRCGEATSFALLEACGDNLERANPKLNAAIWLDRAAAESAARGADDATRSGGSLGRLHGIPLLHKDMYYQAGKPCTCGSRIRRDF
ncbi:MAG: amidase family protein, partial [Pseudomonadota bacterium]|nr:amidase family protein [Pseudomonadota bacterium]